MQPVSSANTRPLRPLDAAEKALGVPKTQRAKEAEEDRPLRPRMDEYVPEKKQEPCGRYWPGRDGDGRPTVYFDSPDRPGPPAPQRTAEAPGDGAPAEPRKAEGPEGPEEKGEKEERWVCNTDQVDREIEETKKRKEDLERHLASESDEAKIKELRRQLDQVSRELCEKDNDQYRKQHAAFTRLS
nr:hypothetical protein [uncultured Oscillibacter sp.]